MDVAGEGPLQREVRRREALQVEYGGTRRPVHAVIPEVSVLVVTYQQVAFVRECLDGILAQRLDAPFEVVIGEDGSDDGTRELCIECADAHPDRIRLFLRDRALTQLPMAGLDDSGVLSVKRLNGRFTRTAARAGILAFCEGDDRWTDPTKLQRQLDVLRADPSIAVVTHRATVEWTTSGTTWQYAAPGHPRQDTRDVIWDRGTPTCAVMMRDVGLDDARVLDWSCRTLSVDYLVRALASHHGDTWFIDRDMAVHRKHPGGLSQSAAYRDRLRLAESTRNLYLAVRELGPADRRRLVQPKLAGVTGKLALAELAAGHRGRAARHAVEAVALAASAPVEVVRQQRTIAARLRASLRSRGHA